MTSPQQPPAEPTAEEEQSLDDATEEVIAAAVAIAAAAWLTTATASILAVPGIPNLSFLPSGAAFISDAVNRVRESLRLLWEGTGLEPSIPYYMRDLPYRLEGLQRQAWSRSSRALAEAQQKGADAEEQRRVLAQVLDPAEWEGYVNRVGQTEASISVNSGRQREAELAADRGARVVKSWRTRLDNRVRETHRDAEGQTRLLGEPFLVGGWPMQHPGDPAAPPSEVVNCFPGWVSISTAGLRTTWRRWYEGDLLTLHFASGLELPVTPNHPLLTISGDFVAAGDIREGDHLIRVDSRSPWTSFEDLYTRTTRCFVPQQSSGQRADFHGDGTPYPTDTVSMGVDSRIAVVGELTRFARALARYTVQPSASPTTTVPSRTEEVVGTTTRPFAGFVFNLDSGLGWYTANGIVAANCRCVATYDISGGPRR